MIRISRLRRLPLPQVDLFDLAADIESYPDFLPDCVATRILERRTDSWLVDNLFAWGPLRRRFRTRAAFAPPRRIDIRSLDAPVADFRLAWTFAAEQGETVVGFEMSLDLPGGTAFLEPALDAMARRIEEAFARRATALLSRRTG